MSSRKKGDAQYAKPELQVASANSVKVRVVCRIRPLLQREIDAQPENSVSPLKIIDANTIEVYNDKEEHAFIIDRVYGIDTSQLQLYEDTCSPLVQDVINGYNATIFAYGQTGTGKTFTMEGNINDIDRKGIIPRSFESLYQSLNELHSSIEYSVKVSYIEIYMERIKDLLEPTRSNSELVIREDKTKGIYISGVTEATVESYDELLSIMTTGSTNRAVAATKMNEGSSRSHSVFSITVSLRNTSTFITKVGKLVLVDLAGSEMVKKTNAQGQQLEEAKTINKSLSALGQVINALACEKQGHIPFRDSKLTRILQDSLGGNSKTVLVVNISASIFDTSETLSTLRFGMRAKGIQTRVTMNQLHRSVEELELLLKTKEEIIDTLLLEIDTLKQENLVQTAEFEQQLKLHTDTLGEKQVEFEQQLKLHTDTLGEKQVEFEQQLKLHTDTLGEKQVEFEQLQTSKTLDDTWLIEEYILEVVKLKEDLLVERNAKTELVKQIEASNVTLETLRKRVSELEEVNATLLVSANESSEAERLRKDLYELQVSTMKQASTLKLLTDELQLYKTKSTQAIEKESELLLTIDRLEHNLENTTTLMKKEREGMQEEIKQLRGKLLELENELEYKKRIIENDAYELEKSKLKLTQVEHELTDMNRAHLHTVEKANKFNFDDVYAKEIEEESNEGKHSKLPARMAFAMRSPNLLPHSPSSATSTTPPSSMNTRKSVLGVDNPVDPGNKWVSNPLSIPQRSSLATTESPLIIKKNKQQMVDGVPVIDDNASDASKTTSVLTGTEFTSVIDVFSVFGENIMAGVNIMGESINDSLDAVGESIGESTGGIDLTSTIDTISSPFMAFGSLFGTAPPPTTNPVDDDGVAQQLDFAGVYKEKGNE